MEDNGEIRRNRRLIFRRQAEERHAFLAKHPEFSYSLGTLLGTVLSCKGVKDVLTIKNVTLGTAYEHYQGCEWCTYNYALAAEQMFRDMSSATLPTT